MIQNVLKEFEDDMVKHHSEQQQPIYQQTAPPVQQPYQMPCNQYAQPVQQTVPAQQHYGTPRKLIDMNILKKTAIITIIAFLLQNYNIMSMLLSKLPDSATKHISGKEIFINIIIIFVIFYSLMYFDIL
jgi:hypothetical protein